MKPQQTALITGASAGIGLDLAWVLAEHGYNLILVARSFDVLQRLAADIKSKHAVSATPIRVDLSDPTTPQHLYDSLAAQGIVVDVLINNAGFGLLGRFDRIDESRMYDMIQVNVTSLTALTRLFLPGMIERGNGRVMNVASTAAFQGGPYMTVYYASKAYVLSLTEAIADELRHTAVTITALCPGPTRTKFAEVAQMTMTNLANTPLMMDSMTVARYGYKAMMRGQRVAISGVINRFVAFSTRLVPRRVATRIAGQMQQNR